MEPQKLAATIEAMSAEQRQAATVFMEAAEQAERLQGMSPAARLDVLTNASPIEQAAAIASMPTDQRMLALEAMPLDTVKQIIFKLPAVDAASVLAVLTKEPRTSIWDEMPVETQGQVLTHLLVADLSLSAVGQVYCGAVVREVLADKSEKELAAVLSVMPVGGSAALLASFSRDRQIAVKELMRPRVTAFQDVPTIEEDGNAPIEHVDGQRQGACCGDACTIS